MRVIRTVAPKVERRRRPVALGFGLFLLAAAIAAAAPAITVTYVSAGAVYLDAGRAEGLVVGAVLRVERAGQKLGELEVDFVAEHSSSCKVTSASGEIAKGDHAVVVSLPAAASAAAPPAAEAAPAPRVAPLVVGQESTAYAPARPALRAAGSVAVGARSFSVSGGASSKESNGRLSLRLSNLGGQPLELRVRTRARRITRSGYGPSVETSQSSDRLYELSLAWAPERSRFSLQLGRLVGGPFGGLGYLDGALAQVRLTRRFYFGAFGGARADYTDLGFGSQGTRYGGYFRYATESGPSAGPGFAEVVIGGVTETARGGNASRDYVSVESRFGSGGRWWIFQRAEIDIHRGWRKQVAGDSSQISNAAISASFRLSEALRASLSYDQRRNYLTWETRPRPEEVFVRYFRQGARVGLDWQRSGWIANLGAGVEKADDIDKPTNSAFLSLTRGNAFGTPLVLGGDASYYTGDSVDGWVANLRTSWSFRGGHDLGLTIGASSAQISGVFGGQARTNQWGRLSGTLQLPFRMYLYGEYEYDTGDDFEGSQALLELGYRF
jgi:hypothetical protein